MAELKFLTFHFKDASPSMFAVTREGVAADISTRYATSNCGKIEFSDTNGNIFVIDVADVKALVVKDYIAGKDGGAHS
jgi:hypothetical protein